MVYPYVFIDLYRSYRRDLPTFTDV